jgi:hypothetical protein
LSEVLQESTPEVPSVPLHVMVTGARYQPAPLGGRLGLAFVIGAMMSYLTVKAADELLPAMSVQLPPMLVPVVSGPL